MSPQTLFIVCMPLFTAFGIAIGWILRGYQVDRLMSGMREALQALRDSRSAMEAAAKWIPARGEKGRFLKRMNGNG